jgi:hypothetical protein
MLRLIALALAIALTSCETSKKKYTDEELKQIIRKVSVTPNYTASLRGKRILFKNGDTSSVDIVKHGSIKRFGDSYFTYVSENMVFIMNRNVIISKQPSLDFVMAYSRDSATVQDVNLPFELHKYINSAITNCILDSAYSRSENELSVFRPFGQIWKISVGYFDDSMTFKAHIRFFPPRLPTSADSCIDVITFSDLDFTPKLNPSFFETKNYLSTENDSLYGKGVLKGFKIYGDTTKSFLQIMRESIRSSL